MSESIPLAVSQPDYGERHVKKVEDLEVGKWYEEVRIEGERHRVARRVQVVSVNKGRGKNLGTLELHCRDIGKGQSTNCYNAVYSLADKGLVPQSYGLWVTSVYLRKE